MLTGLEIYRFRGIRELRLDGLAQVNVLMGRNNAGKSSVLEALYLASATFHPKDPLRRRDKIEYLLNRRGKRGLRWAKGREALWFGYDDNVNIRILLKMEEDSLDVRLHRVHEHPTIAPDPKEPLLWCLICGKGYDYRHGIEFSPLQLMYKERLDKLIPKIKKFVENMTFIDASLLRDIRLIEEALWMPLLKDRLDRLVVSTLRGGYDIPIEDLTLAHFGGVVQLVAKLPHTSVRVDDLGDGARYALVMIMAAALARDTALLIEEPESHQHPGGLAKMLEMLLALAKENGTQLFMSTHSIEMARLTSAIAGELGLDVATFFLERSPDGLVSARRISPEESELLRAMGLDPRFLDIL